MHATTPLPTEGPREKEDKLRPDLFLSSTKSLLVTPKELYSPHPPLVNGLCSSTPCSSFPKNRRRGSLPLKKRRVIDLTEGEGSLFYPEASSFRADLRQQFQYCPSIPGKEDDDVKLPPSQLRHWKLSEPYHPHSFPLLDEKVALMMAPHDQFPSYASSFDRVQSRASSTYETHDADWKDDVRSALSPAPRRTTGVANDSPSSLMQQQPSPPLHIVTPKPIKTASGNCLGQDKRYTGLSDQVRCAATTTRGRPCAYQAVEKNKYCHLHAAYDTHPPPRRKTRDDEKPPSQDTASNASTTVASFGSSAAAMASNEESSSTTADRTGPSPVVSVASAESPAPKRRHHRNNAKWAVKHAVAPHPLLSMVATDQWQGLAVRVAVGPLTGQVGTVHKWGNGWITIFIPEVGYHNRRSFELYLVEDDDDDSKKTLFRCVSRDGVSPSPTTTTKEAWTPGTSSAAAPSLPFATGGVFRPSLGERTRSTSLGSPQPSSDP